MRDYEDHLNYARTAESDGQEGILLHYYLRELKGERSVYGFKIEKHVNGIEDGDRQFIFAEEEATGGITYSARAAGQMLQRLADGLVTPLLLLNTVDENFLEAEMDE